MTQEEISLQIKRLKKEHRSLDEAIVSAEKSALQDQLYIHRLKKRKLALKDKIASLEKTGIPDIIA